MAIVHSKSLMAAGAITIAAALLGILLPTVMLPLLPDLRPLTSQLLIRLREVAAFLAFTTAIAVGILSTQRKDVHHDNSKKLFLEHHSLGSIFGESGYEEIDHFHTDSSKHTFSPAVKKIQLSKGIAHGDDVNDSRDLRSSSVNMDGVHPQSIWSCETGMEASHIERLRENGEENGVVGEYYAQRRLHRKASSLDDNVHYVAEIEAPPKASLVEYVRNEYNVVASKKSTKRVSFSLASSPSSPKHVANDENIRQSRRDSSAKERDMSANSPGDITGQADAFIAKFKEQLRMQNLESIPKYHRCP